MPLLDCYRGSIACHELRKGTIRSHECGRKGCFANVNWGVAAITRNGINVHFQGLISFLCLRFRTILLFLVASSNYFSNFRAVRSLCIARFSIATHTQEGERNAESLNGACARPITPLRGGFKEDLINRVMNEC